MGSHSKCMKYMKDVWIHLKYWDLFIDADFNIFQVNIWIPHLFIASIWQLDLWRFETAAHGAWIQSILKLIFLYCSLLVAYFLGSIRPQDIFGWCAWNHLHSKYGTRDKKEVWIWNSVSVPCVRGYWICCPERRGHHKSPGARTAWAVTPLAMGGERRRGPGAGVRLASCAHDVEPVRRARCVWAVCVPSGHRGPISGKYRVASRSISKGGPLLKPTPHFQFQISIYTEQETTPPTPPADWFEMEIKCVRPNERPACCI